MGSIFVGIPVVIPPSPAPGVITPGSGNVIPSMFGATIETSCVKLARYAQIIRYDENAFFGINAPNNRERDCRKIWTKLERDMIARYLGEAQVLIEGVLGYPLCQHWYVDEQHHNTRRFFTQWSHVISLGMKAISTIALNIALDHTNDPATIAPTATVVTDADEIHFYQAGTDIEIYPDTLTLSGGFVSASFPRARLVLEAFQDNPDTGLSYSDTSGTGPYTQNIDIKRIYTDTSDVGEFVWPMGKGCPQCTEDTTPACGYIRSNESGVVTLLKEDSPISYCFSCGRSASELRINYCAGKPLTPNDEDAIIHLAHSLMPIEPCPGCDPLMMLWKRDREIPSQITQERADCMFGVFDGAWRAWNYAHNNKHFRTPML